MNTHKKSEPWYFTEKIIRKHMIKAVPYMKGRLLDAGCGKQRYKDLFKFDEYVGLEYNHKFKPDVIGDIRNLPFNNFEFDSILNNQVLEHIEDTDQVFREFHRILKSGGYICLTIPFIGRIHGSPFDYWRFSEFGIRHLFDKYGFKEVLIQPMGGFFTTQSYLWIFWFWEQLQGSRFKEVFRKFIIFFLNYIALIIYKIDRDTSTPYNYLAIGSKL